MSIPSDTPRTDADLAEEECDLLREYAARWLSFREGIASGVLFAQINANDLFAYACADAEEIESPEELDAVMDIFRVDGWPGLVEWIERKRGVKALPSKEET